MHSSNSHGLLATYAMSYVKHRPPVECGSMYCHSVDALQRRRRRCKRWRDRSAPQVALPLCRPHRAALAPVSSAPIR